MSERPPAEDVARAQREALSRIIIKAALWGWDAHDAGAQRETVAQTAAACVTWPGPSAS